MIYLLEGPDGAGKSFLAEHLANNGFRQIDLVPKLWPAQYEIYRDLFTDLELNEPRHCVMDRCFVSELVYRTVKNDRPANITLSEIVDLLDNFHITIIYCKNKNAFENAMIRGETHIIDKCEHEKLTITYDIIIQVLKMFCNVSVVEYDWQTDNLNDLTKELS